MTVVVEEDDFADSWRRWSLGLCPCCGSTLSSCLGHDDGCQTVTLGERVTMCGECVHRGHDTIPELTAGLLRAIAEGR